MPVACAGTAARSLPAPRQIPTELGLTPEAIGNGEKALEQPREQAFPGTGHQAETEAELRRLRRAVEVLRQAQDILSKPGLSAPNHRNPTTTGKARLYE
jgi:hypothetical protein